MAKTWAIFRVYDYKGGEISSRVNLSYESFINELCEIFDNVNFNLAERRDKKIKKVLDNIVENAVEISEINNCESDDMIETLTMIDNKGYCNEVVHEVGVDCEMVKQIIMMGGLSYKLLNTIISSYNKEKVVLF